MDETVDVVVVGAGLSGLVAGRALHRSGLDVVVLEAGPRLGGRALTETTALGSRVDLGGQWLGHDHHRLAALADEFGAGPYRMHSKKLPLVIDGTRRVRPTSPAFLTAIGAVAALGLVARAGDRPRLDRTTLDTWLRRVPGRTARDLLAATAEVSWTADHDRTSVAAMAHMVRTQHGLLTMLSTTGGAQDSLLAGGVGTIVDGLADELGDRARPDARVTAITQDDDGATVTTATGTIRARKVVVTVPPPLLDRIAFTPALPADRRALPRTTYMGSVYKAIAVYDRPFWRDRKLAEAMVLQHPRSTWFDSSPPDGPGHLCVLIGGAEARRLDRLDPTPRREVVLGPLADRYGDAVLEPVGWHEKAWHRDPDVGGGYMVLPEPGTTAGWPPIDSTPVGHVHWAGSETAEDHPGYLDGAIEAGARVAVEVTAALT